MSPAEVVPGCRVRPRFPARRLRVAYPAYRPGDRYTAAPSACAGSGFGSYSRPYPQDLWTTHSGFVSETMSPA